VVGVPGAVESRRLGVESRRLGEEVSCVSSVAEDVHMVALAPMSRVAPAVHHRGMGEEAGSGSGSGGGGQRGGCCGWVRVSEGESG